MENIAGNEYDLSVYREQNTRCRRLCGSLQLRDILPLAHDFELAEGGSMARVSLISADSAPPEVREIYEGVLRGKPGNVQKALAHRPEMLKSFLSFYGSVGRSLDRKLYELIYLRVSFINGCHYCTQHHVASSKRVGLTGEDWTALKAGNYSRFSEKERTALKYVERLTRAPQQISDNDFNELKTRFSDPEIIDIHMLAGLANLTNRLTDPLGLELEFPEEKV
jgi:uncharacterized peroxidase-related enzyme